MTEVVINRCTLRVVRRDGWSWGPDPERLLQGAVKVLPELIAAALGRISHGEKYLEIAAPVRLTIPVRLHELASMPSQPLDLTGSFQSLDLRSRLTRGMTAALQPHGIVDASQLQSSQDPPEPAVDETRKYIAVRTDSALVDLLLSWLEHGALEQRLASFSVDSLESWHRKLVNANTATSPGISADALAEVVRMIHEIANKISIDASDVRAILSYRIFLAVRAIKLLDLRRCPPSVRDALDRAFPLRDVETPPAEALLDRAADRISTAPVVAQEPRRHHVDPPRSSARGDVHIASALPFLLLGPLSRMGYLRVLAATLEAAEATHHLTTFAAALAYKVLDPPERGWRREASALQSAATFAGLSHPADGGLLHDLCGTMSKHLSPLDSLLTDSLVEGHQPRSPLLLQRHPATGDYVLLDVDGLFPISCCERPEPVLSILAKCPSSFVLVPAAIADPALLNSLCLERIGFVTDAQPTRSEKWRRIVDRTGQRWWTNDDHTSAAMLVKAAHAIKRDGSDAEQLVDEMFTRRPILPPPNRGALDRHISLAAAIGLGTIAWTLWKEREPTTPQLVLQRFGDLDGRVTFTADHVRVRLPMGRRYQDLLEHRLLEDVDDVPWFEGRTVQFSGG